MKCSRQSNAKLVDFSKTKDKNMQYMIQAFVGRRSLNPPSMRVIQKWFSATPAEYVLSQVNEAVYNGKIDIRRNGLSQRAGYVYQVNDEK